jgi:phosphoribosylanthranilate isomerase
MIAAKICGVTRPGDAIAAARLGAAVIGVVFAPGKRTIDIPTARRVFAELPAPVARAGVFVDPTPEQVADAVAQCALDWVQLSGYESAAQVRELAQAARPARILKAIHVGTRADIDAHADYAADAFLLDAPARDHQLGGTGRTFDWSSAAELPWPGERVVLSGGLRAELLAAAMTAVPAGAVDVCSGVEQTPGIKDPELLEQFMQALRTWAPRLTVFVPGQSSASVR